ncbi:hypothetical protein REPUB_Repub17cG0121100 [Reevesia pubescens]
MLFCFLMIVRQILQFHTVEFAMKKSLKALRAWKLPVLVLVLLSLRIEIVYRDGVTRRETQLVKFVFRDSLQIPRRELEPQNQRLVSLGEGMNVGNEFSQCTSAADRGAFCCQSLALTFTMVLLVKHFLAVLNGETDHYPLALLTKLIFRATGILLPMYIMIRTITAIRNSIRRQYHDSDEDTSNSDEDDDVEQQQ